ncbi:MAG: GNAT family N-acetyltransferase [Planctomycetes bacterium]|nr:GNAT family N-acetyltransferase [Planctomycetota bacterium]
MADNNEIDLKKFERRIKVRPLRKKDFPALIEMGKKCFPGMKPWDEGQLDSQIANFPEGQFVVVYENRLVASATSLVIDFDEYEEKHSWAEIADSGYIRNHNPDGDTLYGIEIMVDPEFRGMKLSRRLYNARKQLCREMNLRRIVIGGRIPGYSVHKDKMSARDYVDHVISRNLYDPVMTAQIANGFVLKRLIRSYLPSDAESDSYATLLEWVNLDYRPPSKKRFQSSRHVRICCVQYRMRTIKTFEDFVQQVEYFTDVASNYHSDFVLFPEIFTTEMLSFIKAKDTATAVRKLAEYTPRYLEELTDLAVKYNVNIIGGSHFSIEEGYIYNIAYLFRRDGSIGKQYKLHITPNERRWWGVEPGDRIEVFDTDAGRIAIQICYDIEFPELARIAVTRGAQIIFTPFCTDERQGYLRVRYCAQARAVENQVFVAIAGTVGNLPMVENMDIQYAQSAILTPSDFGFSRDGIAGECAPGLETVVINDVDIELLDRARQGGAVQNWKDRRLDLYEVRGKDDAPVRSTQELPKTNKKPDTID